MELQNQASVGKRQLIGNVNYVAYYAVLHHSADVLRKRLLGLSVIKKVNLISEKTKGYCRSYFKTMRKGINLAFYTKVVIEGVTVKVAELGSVTR